MFLRDVKADFPILKQKINGNPIIYLDSAATSQKPFKVIDALTKYYMEYNANVHRGVHFLSLKATEAYEAAREKVRSFINAKKAKEIIFTRGTTSALNLVAFGFGKQLLAEGDKILLTPAEHHSNLLPWQQVAKLTGAKIQFLKLKEDGSLDIEDFKVSLSAKTKILAIQHVSNVLGLRHPIKEIAKMIHDLDGFIVVDAAQSAPHLPLDVLDLDVDFLAFSSHKLCGPTGIGVLYGKEDLLEKLVPLEYGGEMVEDVGLDDATFKELPFRLEAGTPMIAEAIGLAHAIEYLEDLGMENVEKHSRELAYCAFLELSKLKGVTCYGPKERFGIISFTMDGIHPHDIATVLDSYGIEIRAGHHCCKPLMNFLNVTSTARASFYIYNTLDDVAKLVWGLKKVREYFKKCL